MNKWMAAALGAVGLTANGNSAYGFVKGYEMNFSMDVMDNLQPAQLHISFYATDEQKRAMEMTIRNTARAAKMKFATVRFTAYGMLVGMNDLTVKRLAAKIPQIFEWLVGVISSNGGLGADHCPYCGGLLREGESSSCMIDGSTVRLDNACVSKINEVIEAENRDFAEAPNNMFKGFWGALLGGLAGAAIVVVLYIAGFISSISAIVAVVLGAFLYQKFGGKPNAVMIVIVSVTSLVCLVAAHVGTYAVASWFAVKENHLTMTLFEAFSFCMHDDDISKAFYTDLALLFVFSVVGIVLEIVVLAKKIRRKKTIR